MTHDKLIEALTEVVNNFVDDECYKPNGYANYHAAIAQFKGEGE